MKFAHRVITSALGLATYNSLSIKAAAEDLLCEPTQAFVEQVYELQDVSKNLSVDGYKTSITYVSIPESKYRVHCSCCATTHPSQSSPVLFW